MGEKRSSDAISFEAEEILWQKNILGSTSPDQLRDTVLYLVGLNFALRGGDEHKKLRCPHFNPQLNIKTDEKGVKFLEFREDSHCKTNQGGLSSKNHKPRILKTYGCANPNRNIVQLFEKYVSLLPSDCKNSLLYKYALGRSKITASQWYSDRPVGINSLKKVIKNLTSQAEIPGKFMNHS